MTRTSHANLDRDSRAEKAHKIAAILGRNTLNCARLLEVGTGSGVISAELSQLVGGGGTVESVDVVDERLDSQGYKFTLVDGIDLPFAAGAFDVVVSNHVIEHVGTSADQRRHISEICRVLAPEGTFYLATPSRWAIMEPHFRLPFLSWLPGHLKDRYVQRMRRGDSYDVRLLSRREVRSLFASANLSANDVSTKALELFARETGAGPAARLVARLPDQVLQVLRSVFPTMIYIGRHQHERLAATKTGRA